MAKRFWDYLFLISSTIFLIFLILLLWYSLFFITDNYPNLRSLQDRMYYVAVAIAVITVTAQWIEGRVKSIRRSWSDLKLNNALDFIKEQQGGVKNGSKE